MIYRKTLIERDMGGGLGLHLGRPAGMARPWPRPFSSRVPGTLVQWRPAWA